MLAETLEIAENRALFERLNVIVSVLQDRGHILLARFAHRADRYRKNGTMLIYLYDRLESTAVLYAATHMQPTALCMYSFPTGLMAQGGRSAAAAIEAAIGGNPTANQCHTAARSDSCHST